MQNSNERMQNAADTRFVLVKGDITKNHGVSAIVNAANTSLLGGGGVDGAIHRAAGPELLAECRMLNGCKTGKAKITKGYNLPCAYVIHTPGPVWNGGRSNEHELLASCYQSCLKLAVENGIKSIAFPSISTGIYHFPLEKAAEIALGTAKKFAAEHPGAFDVIKWVLFDDRTLAAYEHELTKWEGRGMFREMRRSRQMLSKKECEDILYRGTAGVLAVMGDGEYPYAVPLSYVYDNGKIYFHSADSGHKIDGIRKHAKASFCVIDQDEIVPEEYTTYYRSVIVFGQARVIEDEQEQRKAILAMGKKYYPDDGAAHRDEVIEKEGKTLCLLELCVRHMTGKEAIELVKARRA